MLYIFIILIVASYTKIGLYRNLNILKIKFLNTFFKIRIRIFRILIKFKIK